MDKDTRACKWFIMANFNVGNFFIPTTNKKVREDGIMEEERRANRRREEELIMIK